MILISNHIPGNFTQHLSLQTVHNNSYKWYRHTSLVHLTQPAWS